MGMQNKLAYGFALTVVGMGGTLVSLWLLSLLMELLKRFFPYRDEQAQKEQR
jgi:Na+-transporting methylmalonyl-CoA/oxaloacetate decarboxylase gamma subunit